MCSVAAVVSPALFFSHKQGGLFASAAAAAAAVGAVAATARAPSHCAQGHFWDGHMQDGSWCPKPDRAEDTTGDDV